MPASSFWMNHHQLDPLAEYQLFTKFRELLNQRTAIIISHRFSTVEHADRILVMADGCIIESGNHAELIALGGQYAMFYHIQKSKF